MKRLVLGVSNRNGVSKKTGNRYDMSRLAVAEPIVPASKEGMAFTGAGYQGSELEIRKDCIPQFMSIKYPVVLDLQFDFESHGGRVVPVVIGYEGKASEVAA